jgi:hypothetical protein
MLASKQSSFQYPSPEPNVVIPTNIEPACGTPLLDHFFGWLSIIDKTVSEADRPSAELIKIMTRFIQLSSLVRSQPLVDGHPETADIIREALEINADLESWRTNQIGIWTFTEHHLPDSYPPQAVLEGSYHVYDNTYVARTWNHYRWTHILTNQLLLESLSLFPTTATSLLPPDQLHRSLATIRRLARDVLVSVPTHYRHPALRPEHVERFDETKPGSGIGVSGLPTLLFQVKVAGCAPGLQEGYRAWALGVLETAYGDIGMFQANALAGFLRRMVEGGGEGRSVSPADTSSESVGSVGGR